MARLDGSITKNIANSPFFLGIKNAEEATFSRECSLLGVFLCRENGEFAIFFVMLPSHLAKTRHNSVMIQLTSKIFAKKCLVFVINTGRCAPSVWC